MNAPQHAAVFCVDEKSAIQALDRLDPVLPLSPGRAEWHGFESYRHGTLSLHAALDVKTGKVEGRLQAVIPVPSLSSSSAGWLTKRDGQTRSTSCSITSRHIRHRRSAIVSRLILKSGSTLCQLTRPG
jgi:hypothetical protein